MTTDEIYLFDYPTGRVIVTARSYESRLCDGCRGPKTAHSGRCWKCAGQHEPRPRPQGPTNHAARAYKALARHHPIRNPGETELLRWAASLPDARLLQMRNIGRGALEWIRAHQPAGVEPATVECPKCHGAGRVVA